MSPKACHRKYSNTVLYIPLFSRMIPALLQLKEFCLLTEKSDVSSNQSWFCSRTVEARWANLSTFLNCGQKWHTLHRDTASGYNVVLAILVRGHITAHFTTTLMQRRNKYMQTNSNTFQDMITTHSTQYSIRNAWQAQHLRSCSYTILATKDNEKNWDTFISTLKSDIFTVRFPDQQSYHFPRTISLQLLHTCASQHVCPCCVLLALLPYNCILSACMSVFCMYQCVLC